MAPYDQHVWVKLTTGERRMLGTAGCMGLSNFEELKWWVRRIEEDGGVRDPFWGTFILKHVIQEIEIR